MGKHANPSVDRRSFLKGAALAGAATLADHNDAPARTSSQAQVQPVDPRRSGAVPLMSPIAESSTPQEMEPLTTEHSGSDFMVDVIKSLGIEFICANPGSSFRGLQESIINYGGNHSPEFITCLHEESSVSMAHGFAKVEGKPLMILAHGTVGLQHASMAIYNAYCDRVPVYIIGGNIIDATKRIPPVEWAHSVQDAAAMVRDYVKWDDLPTSLNHFAESAIRAYKIAMTVPTAPVLLVADAELQENPISETASSPLPNLVLASPPQGDSGSVA